MLLGSWSFGFLSPSRVFCFGVLAQLVERLNGIEEVSGSIPLGSIPFNTLGIKWVAEPV